MPAVVLVNFANEFPEFGAKALLTVKTLIGCLSKNHPFGGTWSVSVCIGSCLDMFRGAIIFYREGGLSVCGGGGARNFLGWSKGSGPVFFSGPKGGGTRIF